MHGAQTQKKKNFTSFCQPTRPITCANYGNHVQVFTCDSSIRDQFFAITHVTVASGLTLAASLRQRKQQLRKQASAMHRALSPDLKYTLGCSCKRVSFVDMCPCMPKAWKIHIHRQRWHGHQHNAEEQIDGSTWLHLCLCMQGLSSHKPCWASVGKPINKQTYQKTGKLASMTQGAVQRAAATNSGIADHLSGLRSALWCHLP